MLDSKVLSLIFFWFLATSAQAEGPCKGTEWSEWSACCKACTKSIEPFHERFREICNVAGEPMPLYDFQPCDPEELLTEWSSWSECNAECDEIGSLSRTRVCGDEEFTETEEQECSGEPCSNCDPCNLDGSDSTPCDEDSGLCNCITGYSGSTCESCQSGYKPSGTLCIDCGCNMGGTEGDSTCDTSGQCNCVITGYEGLTCSTCESGFYEKTDEGFQCEACSCYTQNTNGGDVECDDGTGQCDCITGASGQICDACISGYYSGSSGYCEECNCNTSGTVDGNSSCNASGQCYCATGYEGDKCDTCSNFYYVIGNTCNFCNCNGWGVATDSFAIGNPNEENYECDDDTGDCGPCFPGFTGLQCADCADDFEIVYDYSDYYDEGQVVYCRKECPEGWKLLDKYNRPNYDWYADDYEDHYNTYPNYCYQAVNEPLSFDDAIAKCAGMGATLLEPNWLSESYYPIFAANDQFEDDADPGKERWVGVKFDGKSDTNTFGWSYASTGDALISSTWTFLDYGATVGCAVVFRNGNFQSWNTRDCSEEKPFICQRLSTFDQPE